MSSPGVNANTPQIPDPVADVRSLTAVLIAVKQAIESLCGYRGEQMNRAVTFNDLVNLGLVTRLTASSLGGKATYASSSIIIDLAPSVAVLTPASGDTVSLATGQKLLFVNTGSLAALTVKLPALPSNNDYVELSFAADVASLAVQDAGGTTVASAPTSADGPGSALFFRFVSASIGWVYWK